MPAAVATWVVAFVVVVLPAGGALAAGCLAGAGVAVVGGWRRTHRTRVGAGARGLPGVAGLPGVVGRAGLVGQGILVLVVAGAVALSAAGQLAVRGAGLLGVLIEEEATVRVVGTVRSEPAPLAAPAGWGDPEVRYRVVLGVDRVTGRGRTGSAAASVLVLGGPAWAEIGFGARVEVDGRLMRAEPGRSEVAILSGRGAPRVVDPPGAVDRAVRQVRVALLVATDRLAPDPRGLVPGIAVGDTSRLPPDLAEAMRVAGLTHLTAVSGAHFAIIGAAVLALTGAIGLPRRARIAAVVTAMGGLVLLVHAEPSVLRAAAMGAIGAGGMLLGRPSRALAALGATVIALLVVDPWLARSYGFALSALATAGIVLLTGPIAQGPGRALPRGLAQAIAVPLSAQAVCAPVIVLLNPALALYAVPANLAAAPAIAPATVAGALAAMVAPWWATGGAALAHVAGWGAWWIAQVARGFAALPGAQLPWPGGAGGAGLLAAVTLVVGIGVVRGSRVP